MKPEKRIAKRNLKRVLFLTIFTICLISLIISSFNIIKWYIDKKKTDDQINDISKIVKIEKVSDNKNTRIVKQEDIDKNNPYWKYIRMNLLQVDFSKLKKINASTKGWIEVKNTNVNYPFVQADDNSFYLTHSFDKSYNEAGWVFLDYRNSVNLLGKNTIIYAHGRYDGTMFGSLKKIVDDAWLNNTDNHVVRLSTETENTLWQVFSVYHLKTTSDYLRTSFETRDDFQEFANKLKKRSVYHFDTTISKNDKILTLSTCYNSEEKVVLHAKLIKSEKR